MIMIKHILSSAFIKIYLAILAVFLLVTITAVGIYIYNDSVTSLQDFIDDTRVTRSSLEDLWENQPEQWQSIYPLIASIFSQRAYVYNSDELEQLVSKFNLLEDLPDIKIYSYLQDETLHAVYPMADAAHWLVISDLPHNTENPNIDENLRQLIEKEESRDELLAIAIIAVLVVFLLLVALVLLYSINQLTQQILKLSHASQQFASGKLDVRVSTSVPAPLNQLAKSFNRMAAEIQSGIEEQEVMSHAIAHELRTPLTRLRLALGIASRQAKGAQVEELFQSMDVYIDELDGLSDMVLTLAKLNHKSNQVISKESFSLTQLIQERVREMSELKGAMTLKSHIPDQVQVYADPFFIQLAIDNLLTNAIRHCTAHVRVSLVEGGENILHLIIEDDGQGIPAAEQASVFLPFARLDESRDRKSGGYGLGLSIVKSVADRHAGTVSADSSDLGGAKFVFNLPVH